MELYLVIQDTYVDRTLDNSLPFVFVYRTLAAAQQAVRDSYQETEPNDENELTFQDNGLGAFTKDIDSSDFNTWQITKVRVQE